MPSLVWGRDPQEAYENPYKDAMEEQFRREANQLLTRLYRLLCQRKTALAKTIDPHERRSGCCRSTHGTR